MAIRFVDTEVFTAPLYLRALERLWAEDGQQFFAPQSPTVVDEHMFCLIYQQSSAYAS
jgi:hypothetical protein